MKRFILSFMFVLVVSAAQAQDNKGIVVTKAWVETVPPVESVTAAYMTIENKTGKDMILDSVSTSVSAVTEIHQMSHVNGVMKMRMLKNLPISAGGKAVLEPGGNHLMLINLMKIVKKGDIVPISLYFHDGTVVLINAKAKPEGPCEDSCTDS